MFEKFPGHVNLHSLKISANRGKHLEHGRDIVANRKVQRLDVRPEGESPVGDNQRVRVPNSRQQRKQMGVKDFQIEHAELWAGQRRPGKAKSKRLFSLLIHQVRDQIGHFALTE